MDQHQPANTPNPLIIAIVAGDMTTACRLLQTQPALAVRADPHGNTPLHHAAAVANRELIVQLIDTPGVDHTIRNHAGETAADWFRGYASSARYYWEHRHDLQELQQLLNRQRAGDLEFVEWCLMVKPVRIMRFTDGETLLHLAVQAGQLAIVKAILDPASVTAQTTMQLLTTQNGQGKTPLQLAETGMQSGVTTAVEIFNTLQTVFAGATSDLQAAVANPALADDDHHSVSPLQPETLVDLTKLLQKPLSEQAFPQLQPFLSTFCQLAALLCQQARAFLNASSGEAPTAQARWQQHQRVLAQLFGSPLDSLVRRQLMQTIDQITDDLHKRLRQPDLTTRLKLSCKNPHRKGRANFLEDIIYLNPLCLADRLITWMATLLHELSHAVCDTIDLFYYEKEPCQLGNLTIVLEEAHQVWGREAQFPQLPQEPLAVLKTAGLLTHPQQPECQWLAMHNADTLAVAILALAAIPNGCAEVTEDSLTIKAALLAPDTVTYFCHHPDTPLPEALIRRLQLRPMARPRYRLRRPSHTAGDKGVATEAQCQENVYGEVTLRPPTATFQPRPESGCSTDSGISSTPCSPPYTSATERTDPASCFSLECLKTATATLETPTTGETSLHPEPSLVDRSTLPRSSELFIFRGADRSD